MRFAANKALQGSLAHCVRSAPLSHGVGPDQTYDLQIVEVTPFSVLGKDTEGREINIAPAEIASLEIQRFSALKTLGLVAAVVVVAYPLRRVLPVRSNKRFQATALALRARNRGVRRRKCPHS